MTILLDAYAAIAVLKGEPAASDVRPALEEGTVLIHPLNLGEVIDRMVRLAAADADDIEADIAILGVETVQPDPSIMVDAGRWRSRHYHRTERPVSMADCVAGLCATSLTIPLATSGGPCAAMVRAEGGSVVALPNSQGVRPA